MSIFSRFFGQTSSDERVTRLIANPQIERPLSLAVLFDTLPRISSESFTSAMRRYHSSMGSGRCEFDSELQARGTLLGMAGWHKHVIRLVGFDLPMPVDAVDSVISPAHYSQELEQQACSHSGHVLLYYGGYDSSAYEQYVALAAIAGVIASFGGIIVLNEPACTSFPADALTVTDGDMFELLRTFPLLLLYCGFVKIEIDGTAGVWMRTYGAHLLGLPDLAVLANGHHEGQQYFEMFSNILDYLRESGASFAAGHTMELGDEVFMRLREPVEDEYFLDSDGEIFVAEIIGSNEING